MVEPTLEAFLDSPLGQTITQQSLDAELKQAGHWQERYRLLMKLGQRMPKLTPELHQASAEVSGCESATWLYHLEDNDRHYFLADSDARIVRGLLVLVLAACNGKTSAELKAIDLKLWFKQLSFDDHLSPSRSNGINAVIDAIHAR